MLPPGGDAENTGLNPGLRAQSSTLRTKMVLPKQAQRRQVKNNPEQHTKPPLGEGNSFPGTWWAYFPVPFLLEKEAEGSQHRVLAGGCRSLGIPVARQHAGTARCCACILYFGEGRGSGAIIHPIARAGVGQHLWDVAGITKP